MCDGSCGRRRADDVRATQVRAGHFDVTVVGNGWTFELLPAGEKHRIELLERDKEEELDRLMVEGGLKYWCCSRCDAMSYGCSYTDIRGHVKYQ